MGSVRYVKDKLARQDVGEIPCACGTVVFFTLGWSDALLCYVLTVRHRGGKLFEWVIHENDGVLYQSGRIIDLMANSTEAWRELKEYNLRCAEFWDKIDKTWRAVADG